MRGPDALEHASYWLRLATGDLEAAETCLKDKSVPRRVAAGLAQQAAEKGLKALVALEGREPPRTHDLAKLATLVRGWSDVADRTIDLAGLAAALLSGRYPE